MTHAASFPTQTWYSVATADEVTRTPLARRAVGQALVLYRTAAGGVVVLADRDAHAPYPLSLGRLDGDDLVSAYSGFAYGPDGRCTRVPTQPEVPYDARVRAFPAREQDGLVWVWFGREGSEGLAALRTPPRARWLADDAWSTLGEEWVTRAGMLLLHENFADITHVAVVDPVIAPPVLTSGPVPRLEVEVTETSVGFRRDYPAGPVSDWLAPLLGLAAGEVVAQCEEGRFVAPGLWVDSWCFDLPDGGSATFRFTHAVTPVDAATSLHLWRVSRDFAPGAEVSAQLQPLFAAYYRRVQTILQTMQGVLDADGPRPEVRVAADAAAIAVRRIVHRMVADERLI